MKLSVVVPSIRLMELPFLYDSIMDSFEDTFEMIVIGPYSIMWPLSINDNIKFIKSFRSPNSCQQIGLLKAKGEFISFAADDGVFLPGALDKALKIAEEEIIVVGKYLEGDNPNPDMAKEDYYRFKYHKTYHLPGVPQDGLIFNCGVISRKLITDMGGWDTKFEATTMAHADLGIRAKKYGADMVLLDTPMFKCSHEPGRTGTHGPVHDAMKRDIKYFRELYSQRYARIKIDINNWENTPEKWEARFG